MQENALLLSNMNRRRRECSVNVDLVERTTTSNDTESLACNATTGIKGDMSKLK